ncbi:MAG: hypothetical protein J6Z17_02985 [Treponema sp.]|nr:hypothetical protein [Treponema sp.]
MSKKSRIGFTFDSPLVIIFSVICAALFLLDTFVLKGKITVPFLMCPASVQEGSTVAFNFSSPLDYVKILIHIFGVKNTASFFACLLLFISLGTVLEERYGSLMLLVMILTSALVSGVLTACIGRLPLSGQEAVVLMMIFLNLITAFTKKVFPFSAVLMLLLFTGCDFYVQGDFALKVPGIICVCIDLIAGLCGSLFGYLVSPKKRTPKPKSNSAPSMPSIPSYSDDTVVGEISL